jgi:ubiquinone/menaquinone biosynthesis C-methylase UbiE
MVSLVTKRVAAQLRRPSGAFGRVVMTRLLDRGNAEIIGTTLDALGLEPSDTYLDVGFGGGRSLRRAAASVDGHLWGVDLSPDVVATGQRRLRRLVERGRLTLLVADVEDLPLRDGLVSSASTINTIYFWSCPDRALRSLHRVLAPGGRLAIGFSGADKMRSFDPITQHGFQLYEPGDVEALLGGAGFSDVSVTPGAGRRTRGDFVVVARR